MMSLERIKPDIYTPTRRPHLRKGRGFSLEEIRKAGLSLQDAKRRGVPIDNRRRTAHSQNVQMLKEKYGLVIPLTDIKGVGELVESELKDAKILDANDLANADLNDLSKKVPHSKKTLRKWQVEAQKRLTR
jgi:large subunit ribosomal protein L13e